MLKGYTPVKEPIFEFMQLPRDHPRVSPTSSITIRPAYADDDFSLSRLAALDSADAVPAAPRLVAEVDGRLVAAVSLTDGSSIADPFTRTADVVELLRKAAAPRLVRRGRRGLTHLRQYRPLARFA
jgi:hypothetical protein